MIKARRDVLVQFILPLLLVASKLIFRKCINKRKMLSMPFCSFIKQNHKYRACEQNENSEVKENHPYLPLTA